MNRNVADLRPMLKSAIAEARNVGLEAAASQLESRAFAAYTTSSELLGETGDAIKEFLKAGGSEVPPLAASQLNRCLKEIRKVWPRL